MEITIYFSPEARKVWSQKLQVVNGTTIEDAIRQSEFATRFPEFHLPDLGIAVHGRRQPLSYILQVGDRIELCRHLVFDPMTSRRRRAAHREAGILKKKHLKPDRSKHQDYVEYRDNKKFKETL